MKPGPPEIIFIVGPTGTGKSDVALALARRRGAAILAMDSMQVYRGADIGTGKPSLDERKEIAHGGLDLIPLGESFDTASYLKEADRFLDLCGRLNQAVIIVGGTGLYYRALTRGLCDAPPAAQGLREELGKMTLEDLQKRLTEIDPSMVPHLDIQNPRRIARAIEVMETTGTSLRIWQQETRPALVTDFRAYFLTREKEDLHARIDRRVGQMFDAGWVEEVRSLLTQHGQETLENFPAIGYPEIARWLHSGGKSPLPAVQETIALATRQYAKRQLTWFRRERNLSLITMPANENPTATADRLL